MILRNWKLAFCLSWIAYLATAMVAVAAEADEKPDPKGVDFFEKKIRPVLVANCYECHSAKAKSVKGGLFVDTRDGIRKGGESGAAVVPGDLEESLLIEAIKHEGLEMPPKGKLPEAVIADIVKWVQMGAPDPRDGKTAGAIKREINIEEGKQFWAFQPPKAAQQPQLKDKAWPKSDLDRFVLAALEAKGLKPVGDADLRTWLRRVSLDLTGLPPTVAEMEAFEQSAIRNPESAMESVVDRLLASPQFGERWGRHWLDVARYAESTGKERNIPYPYAWRYRDWVIDAVNADKPYDRFIQEQIAGDLIPAENDAQRNAQLIATGFLAMGPKSVNERNALQYIMDEVDEQIDVVGRAVLGTTVGCARCHDHKFDPIPSSDYYALAGIFKSTEVHPGVTRGSRNWDAKSLMALASTGTPAAEEKKEEAPEEPAKANKQQKQLKAAKAELKELEAQIPELQKKKDKPAMKKLRDQIKDAQRRVTDLEARLQGGGEPADPGAQLAMAVSEARSKGDCKICIRGEVDDLGPEVPRGFVQVMLRGEAPKIDAKESGRLQLAQWLTSRENPLVARVMVNRIWQHLFGVGIVETGDNFGELGSRPTHPELLDHLSVQFMDKGWSVKQAIRSVVVSRTYGLSSDHNEANYAADPDNRLVWRSTRRRLDAEVIRDAVLAASGEIELARPEGSPVMKLGNGEVGRNIRTPDASKSANVRSIYLPLMRGVVPEMLSVFDVADPSLVVGQREVTTVATQALYMMNSAFVMEQSQRMAERLISESSDDAQRVDLAYQRALCRPASASERQRMLTFVSQYQDTLESDGKKAEQARLSAWSSVCQALFASAEFRYVY